MGTQSIVAGYGLVQLQADDGRHTAPPSLPSPGTTLPRIRAHRMGNGQAIKLCCLARPVGGLFTSSLCNA